MALHALPGEPAKVAAEARKMLDAASRMRRAAATLKQLADRGQYRSQAVDALRSNATDVSVVMTKAAVRYEGAGEALSDYAPALEAAQRQATTAIAMLQGTDVGGARASVQRAALDPWEHVTLSEEDKARRAVELADAKADLAEQERAVAAAQALHADAVRDVEVAAQRAMTRIHEANEMSGLNDSFWDNWNGLVDKYINPAIEMLTKILDVISDIIGVIALILAFIPGLQPLAAALAGLSLALKGISLLLTTLQVLMGKKTWGDLLSKAVVLAVSVVLKGGIGKAVTKAKGNLGALRQALPGGKGGVARISPQTLTRSVGNMTKLKPGDEGYDAAAKELLKGGLKLELKYGAKLVEGDLGASYDVNLYSLATSEEYRSELTVNDIVGEGISAVIGGDAQGYLTGVGTDIVGGLTGDAFDHFTGGGTFGTSDLATQDVSSPLTVDFSDVSSSQILAENFGQASVDGEPCRVSLHTAGAGS